MLHDTVDLDDGSLMIGRPESKARINRGEIRALCDQVTHGYRHKPPIIVSVVLVLVSPEVHGHTQSILMPRRIGPDSDRASNWMVPAAKADKSCGARFKIHAGRQAIVFPLCSQNASAVPLLVHCQSTVGQPAPPSSRQTS